jgi:hypothetical protein
MDNQDASLVAASSVSIAAALALAIAFFWPVTPAYQVVAPEEHRVLRLPDGTLRIHRLYCITSNTPITIDRDLVMQDTPTTELRIALPQTTQSYEVGCHELNRVLPVPSHVPPGTYKLKNRASWYWFGIRRESVELPVLMIVVPTNPNTQQLH